MNDNKYLFTPFETSRGPHKSMWMNSRALVVFFSLCFITEGCVAFLFMEIIHFFSLLLHFETEKNITISLLFNWRIALVSRCAKHSYQMVALMVDIITPAFRSVSVLKTCSDLFSLVLKLSLFSLEAYFPSLSGGVLIYCSSSIEFSFLGWILYLGGAPPCCDWFSVFIFSYQALSPDPLLVSSLEAFCLLYSSLIWFSNWSIGISCALEACTNEL